MKKNKKAISPVIGAILLVAFTLALAGIVFVWMRRTSENIGNEQESTLCQNVNYAIGDLCHTGNLVKFNTMNYAQDLVLMGFMMTVEADGESKSYPSNLAEIDSLKSADVSVDIDGISENINRIRIIPRVKSGNEIVNCEDEETIKVWNEIPGC
jgi:flagellin-like protein